MKRVFSAIIIMLIVIANSFALTGGTAMTEYTSFEPADGDQLVNNSTGDFVYTLPIMNVPGKGGSFPLTLSYHAGIVHDQNASWVGLGWGLNAGAINRSVRGLPDDFHNALMYTDLYHYQDGTSQNSAMNILSLYSRTEQSSTWESGTKSANNIMNLLWWNSEGKVKWFPNPSNSGYIWSRGVGVGNPSLDIFSPYQGPQAEPASASIPFRGGLSPGSAGFAFSGKNSSSFLKTDHSDPETKTDWDFLGLGLICKKTTTQEWVFRINAKLMEWNYGYLYQGGEPAWKIHGLSKWTPPPLADEIHNYGKSLEALNQNKWVFPSQDVYECNAPGLGGSFMPVSTYRSDYVAEPDKPFRYFSNQIDATTGDSIPLNVSNKVVLASQKLGTIFTPDDYYMLSNIQFRFLNDPGMNVIGDQFSSEYSAIDEGSINSQGTYRSYASRRIEPVINEETSRLTGFRIIEIDGTIYEFMMPLNEYFEGAHSTVTATGIDATKRSLYRSYSRYAYSWLLTAIKGPDYFDINSNGPDVADGGFWVKLKYTTPYPYKWRVPYGGDINQTSGNGTYSAKYGIKDISYLQEIETASHKATFQLSDRNDGRSASFTVDIPPVQIPLDPVFSNTTLKSLYIWRENSNSSDRLIVNIPGVYPSAVESLRSSNGSIATLEYCRGGNVTVYSTPLLVSDIIDYDSTGNGINVSFSTTSYGISDWSSINKITIDPNAIRLSIKDNASTTLLKKLESISLFDKKDLTNAIGKVQFNYDYSLCGNTPNSISASSGVENIVNGKLVLKDVTYIGKNNTTFPSFVFNYQSGTKGNPNYGDQNKYDIWGMYNPEGTETDHITPQYEGNNIGACWNLTSIKTPAGAELCVNYERDIYYGITPDRITSFNWKQQGTPYFRYNHYYESTINPDGITDVLDYLSGFFTIHECPNTTEMGVNSSLSYLKPGMIILIGVPKNTIAGTSRWITGPYVINAINVNSSNGYTQIQLNTKDNVLAQAHSSSWGQPSWEGPFEILIPKSEFKTIGGDIRVKKLIQKDCIGKSFTTQYTYEYDDGKTSGEILNSPFVGTGKYIFFNRPYRAYFPNSGSVLGYMGVNYVDDEIETYRENVLLPSTPVIYGKVTIIQSDFQDVSVTGKQVLEFFNPADRVTVKGIQHPPFYSIFTNTSNLEVHDYSAIIGMPKAISLYSKEGVLKKQAVYQYSFSEDCPQIQKMGSGAATNAAIGLVTQSNRFNLDIKNNPSTYSYVKQYSNSTYLASVEISTDGLVSRTSNQVLDAYTGVPIQVIEGPVIPSGQSSTVSKKISAIQPAYWVYGGLKSENNLSSICQNTLYEKASSDNSVTLSPNQARSSQATTFSNALGCQAWLPSAVYRWNAHQNGAGVPQAGLTDFIFSDPSTSSNWKLQNMVQKYDAYSNILQIKQPIIGPQTTIFRNDLSLPIGKALNADFMECGVFTGDYNTGESAGFWDVHNGWEKGTTNTTAIVSDAPNAHFGTGAIHVINDFAAGRNNRIIPGKAYRMTAWVRAVSGAISMATDFRYANTGYENEWPAMHITTENNIPIATVNAPSISADDCHGEWKLMKLDIPASVTAQLTANKVWYTRAWVGNPGSTNNNAYVDDVRFGPSNAILATTYFDPACQKEILSVDANNNPGYKSVYDEFGRKTNVKKLNKYLATSSPILDNTFNLKGSSLPSGGIWLLTPNGGETFNQSEPISIRIKSGVNIASVLLQYTVNNGATYNDITTLNLSANGIWNYTWNVPNNVYGEKCRIRAKDPASKVCDVSDFYFPIRQTLFQSDMQSIRFTGPGYGGSLTTEGHNASPCDMLLWAGAYSQPSLCQFGMNQTTLGQLLKGKSVIITGYVRRMDQVPTIDSYDVVCKLITTDNPTGESRSSSFLSGSAWSKFTVPLDLTSFSSTSFELSFGIINYAQNIILVDDIEIIQQ